MKNHFWHSNAFIALSNCILILSSIACTGGGSFTANISPGSTSASGNSPVPSPTPGPSPTPVTSIPTAPAVNSPYVPSGYIMTFDDEFTSLNTISSSSGPYQTGVNWYNGTEQCCMADTTNSLPAVMYPSAVNGLSVNPYTLIPGGGLNITLSKVNNAWYSGVMTSVDFSGKGFSQQYGYFEIRAKFPSGPGTWPGWWMLSTSGLITNTASGEIDIFEQYGQFPTGFCFTLHDWTNGSTPYIDCSMKVADQTTDFHTYGFLWTATTMTVYFDGSPVTTTATPSIMQQPYYMLVDLGLGGGWPTGSTPSANVMQVQYIRAYAPKTGLP